MRYTKSKTTKLFVIERTVRLWYSSECGALRDAYCGHCDKISSVYGPIPTLPPVPAVVV